MASNRNYSSVARLAILQSNIGSTDTTFTVDQTSGFPTPPFTLVLDPGVVQEEIVTATGVAGNTITCLRGQDGSGAQPHTAGAQVRHMATARDYNEPAQHIGLTSGVHGVAGNLVGTSDSSIMDNKTFSPIGPDHTPIIFAQATGQNSPLASVVNSGGTTVATLSATGRWQTPGIDGSFSSTFTASVANATPLIAQAAAGQTANVLSIRNSAGTEVASFTAAGVLNATGVNVTTTTTSTSITASTSPTTPALTLQGASGQTAPILSLIDSSSNVLATVTADGHVSTPGIIGSGQSVFATTATTMVPLVAQVPDTSTVSAIAVRNTSGTSKAGILGGGSGWLLYHGGDITNRVPFKMHGGGVAITMPSGATSIGGSIDISSFGYTVSPIVQLTVKQSETDTIKRRVTVNISNTPTTTAIAFRVIQTSNEPMTSDESYTVHWMAIMFTPTTAAG